MQATVREAEADERGEGVCSPVLCYVYGTCARATAGWLDGAQAYLTWYGA